MMIMMNMNSFFFFYMLLMMVVLTMIPIVFFLLLSDKVYMVCWSIVQVNNSMIDFPIIIDSVGMLTSLIVLFISSNVFRFAMSYMIYDYFKVRFSILVVLFVLSMNLLIFIPSLIILLLGWDGLGLISFLLVIYYQNFKSLGAGMITALTNRIGDGMLLLAISLSLNMNNWNIMNMWEMENSWMIIMFVMIAAMTKSAQMPFSSWLPAAMAAPTPVSALVHSSTLVTAGVFLLVRFYSYMSSMKFFELTLLFLACMTMIMAAFCAIIECDLKKIIALSTLSQLGVMMTSLAIGLPKLALFHLIIHALFKALLFICAGSFIFLHSHNQDLRLVGNLMYQLPMSSSCFIIGSISLCGLPFLAGFYSKDLILEMMLSSVKSLIILMVVMMATGGTAMYSMRLIFFSLMGVSLSNTYHNLSDLDKSIMVSIMNLTFGAIMGGAMISWLMNPFDMECFMKINVKLLPLYFILVGGGLGVILNNFMVSSESFMFNTLLMSDMFSSMWFFSPMSSQMSLFFFKPAYYYLMVVDQGWVESISAQGIYNGVSSLSMLIQPVQSKLISIMMSVSILGLMMVMLSL